MKRCLMKVFLFFLLDRISSEFLVGGKITLPSHFKFCLESWIWILNLLILNQLILEIILNLKNCIHFQENENTKKLYSVFVFKSYFSEYTPFMLKPNKPLKSLLDSVKIQILDILKLFKQSI